MTYAYATLVFWTFFGIQALGIEKALKWINQSINQNCFKKPVVPRVV